MLFRTLSQESPSEPDALQGIWPTIAEPVTFAPPLGIEEDDDALTLHFDVARRTEQDLEVQVDGQTLVILGEALPRTVKPPRRARRLFALPSAVDASRTWMELAPPILKVSIAKSSADRRRSIVVRGGGRDPHEGTP
jgi:HSP20 family molecular chaperone IbpA